MAFARLERDGPVSSIVLSNPPLNLFEEGAFEELVGYVDEVAGSDARALVWRAEGEIFSGGVDVNAFQQVVDAGPERAAEFARPLVDGVRRLEALEIPTLTLAHGICLTAALEVALGTDIIWAGESARFGLVEAVVGPTPGAGGTQRMAERAGPARAREFVYTGGLYDAATLERWGVVNRVVADDDLLEKGMRFAHRLAAGPSVAHAATKRIVRAYLRGGVDAADSATPEQFAGLFASEDLRNGVASFLRDGPGKARFQGR
ncbi:MAG: enoyl-CoA hydratase/isomerase family protein [Solirubrobacterales bacterium]